MFWRMQGADLAGDVSVIIQQPGPLAITLGSTVAEAMQTNAG